MVSQIRFDRVNENKSDQILQYGCNSRKIGADIYIDDKQVGGLPSWDKIATYVKQIEQEDNV